MTVPSDLQLRHILISRFEEMPVSSVPVLPGLPVGQSTCCGLPSGADNTVRKGGIHFDINLLTPEFSGR